MKKFEVTITRYSRQTITVEVEAENSDQACELASDTVDDGDSEWDCDDGEDFDVQECE
jgi:hypothetical protein